MTIRDIAHTLRSLARKLNTENADDKDVRLLHTLAGELFALDDHDVSPMVSYYAGYTAGWNNQREGKSMSAQTSWHAYRASLAYLSDILIEDAVTDCCGSLGSEAVVDVQDPDTGVVLKGVPTMANDPSHQQLDTHLRQPSHTAQMELTDRVAKLETDVMRLRRDMGERIREIATGGKR